MDLREKKTRRSIYNAFLKIRATKPLEKITIKELAEEAEISKATFYLHYKDVYDLSDALQAEAISKIIENIEDPESMTENPERVFVSLSNSFQANQGLVDILFSSSQKSKLPLLVEQAIIEKVFAVHPEYKDDLAITTKLSFMIMGCFYAYLNNRNSYNDTIVIETISDSLKKLSL
ncbi:MAG: TetR/AcrR family transcriptional regulator [Saccharofermentans sp.]|nr:TetR/AcrR family transcriptional regulator [Saccharofermentans sp.]